jgi:hypothetical protein
MYILAGGEERWVRVRARERERVTVIGLSNFI